jgi:hypothetical protein
MKTARWLLALLSLAVAMWVFVSAFRTYRSTPDQIRLVDSDESVVQIFDSVRQDIERFFQMAVLVLGGLWTLAVIDRDQRVHVADYPEIVMFITATVLFLLCFYFIQTYDTVLKQAVWDARTLIGDHGQKLFPDLLHSPYLDLHSTVVVRSFYSGLAVSGLTTVSLCRLR